MKHSCSIVKMNKQSITLSCILVYISKCNIQVLFIHLRKLYDSFYLQLGLSFICLATTVSLLFEPSVLDFVFHFTLTFVLDFLLLLLELLLGFLFEVLNKHSFLQCMKPHLLPPELKLIQHYSHFLHFMNFKGFEEHK